MLALATPPTVTLDATFVALIVGTVVPFVTAILTKLEAHPGLKGVVTLVLAGIAGTVSVLTTNAGHAITIEALVIAIGAAWLSAVGTYLGLWKPTNVVPAVHKATGNFGLTWPASKAA